MGLFFFLQALYNMSQLYVLFETATGYGLFSQVQSEEIGGSLEQVESRVQKFSIFNQMVKLEAFAPFRSAEDALENINALSEGVLHEYLHEFLDQNLPKTKKSKKDSPFSLGVSEEKLAASISEVFPVKCDYRSQTVRELIRGIRLHFTHFVKALEKKDVEQAQLGLSHAYSRSKIKFNVNRADNHIIQSIALLDQLDKDINTFAMRVREWYSWHFPELARVVSDNILFARLAIAIQSKSSLNEDKLDELEEIVNDRSIAEEILEAARTSMGTEISELDMMNVTSFAKRVISLDQYRKQLHGYPNNKMSAVAPNLAALIGDQVGARLIAHAGSLTNLAKYPASTVQILGAEKALFRALKTRGNTPKYGLIFHSSFIGRAGAKNKGRISRYLANKCSIASRIDCFSEDSTTVFGSKLKEQVEDRLKFYETGDLPRKNVEVMAEAVEEAAEELAKRKKKEKKKRKAEDAEESVTEEVVTEEPPKKKKKKNKDKEGAVEAAESTLNTTADL